MKTFACALTAGLMIVFLCHFPANAQDSATPQAEQPIPADKGQDQEIQTFGPGMEDEQAPEQLPSESAKKPEAPQEAATPAPGEAPSQQPGTIEGAAPGIYTIVQGDNLWEICTRFLGNPFEWPKLWAINEYITNPHFIYPGGKIIFKPGTETTPPSMEIAKEAPQPKEETLAQEETPAQEPQAQKEAAPQPQELMVPAVPKEEPKVFEVKLRTISLISPKEMQGAGKIAFAVESKTELGPGDKVYLTVKNPERVNVGDKYIALENMRKVYHPRNGKFLGYQTMEKATLKVTAIDKKILTAVIIDAERSLRREDRIIPYVDPMRRIVPKEIDKEINGYVVGSEPEHRLVGQQEFAYIDRGSKQGVDAGTIFYIVRRGDSLMSIDDKRLPLIIIGKLLVIEPKENTSTVYITDSNQDIEIGDVIKTKLK